jgi:hypothetical protein
VLGAHAAVSATTAAAIKVLMFILFSFVENGAPDRTQTCM